MKISRRFWQYYQVKPNDNLADTESVKSKVKITGNIPNNGNKTDTEIIVPLKYVSNFGKTFEMPLINCEVNLILMWSLTCLINNSTGVGRFAITDTKHYVPVVSLSTQDNTKLLYQLKYGFKITFKWTKYQ